jgi:pyruvyl transferase EpsO
MSEHTRQLGTPTEDFEGIAIHPDATAAGNPDAGLISALARKIEDVLAPVVVADRPVALLDFPWSPNVGDSMIWLGVRAYLARRGIRPCYSCSSRTYSRDALARRIGNGTILLSGGGNFGDLYPTHQELREEVVAAFPQNRIVQLPQTMYFTSPAALDRARRVFDRHAQVTLLVRDLESLTRARESFGAPSQLCPDMAFELGLLRRETQATHPVVWLARDDKEAVARPRIEPPPGVTRVDWVQDDDTPLLYANRRLGHTLRWHPWMRESLQGVLTWTYAPLAQERMQRGVRMLGAGQAVVTNRLHAHILCLLLGIPHTLLDNNYGKVHGFYRAWTSTSALAEWGAREDEAFARAAVRAAEMPAD